MGTRRFSPIKKTRAVTGFTLIEISIAVVVVAILVAFASVYYFKVIGKSEDSEALANLAAIKKAEFTKQAEVGTFVNASDTADVNEKLDSVEVQEKIFRYKVVNATQEDFVAVAERILGAGSVTTKDKPIEIALYADGGLSYTYSSAGSGSGYGSGGYGYSGGPGGAGGSGSLGGGAGVTGGSFGGGAGSGSGSGSGGSSGGDSGGESGGGSGGSGGGGSQPVIAADLVSALDLLESSDAGGYFGDLIEEKGISVIYDDFSQYPVSSTVLAFWWGTIRNTIYVNQELKGTFLGVTWSEAAIAAIIGHEAVHADYEYYPDKWIDITLENHPELTVDDLHITADPGNSIDQEYNAFANEILIWKELKGTESNIYIDYDEDLYDQGEDYLKADLRTRDSYATLSEY
ncbi:MAG TPA: hypothetical protein DCL35_01735 [Candidatus Omnitrophica bacterium]|nr:hypothetical protein [Candidatus Omnitrophota bacterium]